MLVVREPHALKHHVDPARHHEPSHHQQREQAQTSRRRRRRGLRRALGRWLLGAQLVLYGAVLRRRDHGGRGRGLGGRGVDVLLSHDGWDGIGGGVRGTGAASD